MTMTKSNIMKTQASRVQSQSYCLRTRHMFLSPCSACYAAVNPQKPALPTSILLEKRSIPVFGVGESWVTLIAPSANCSGLVLYCASESSRVCDVISIQTSIFCFSSVRRSWVQRFILAIAFWSTWEYSQPLRCHYGYVYCSLLPSLSQLLSHLKLSY